VDLVFNTGWTIREPRTGGDFTAKFAATSLAKVVFCGARRSKMRAKRKGWKSHLAGAFTHYRLISCVRSWRQRVVADRHRRNPWSNAGGDVLKGRATSARFTHDVHLGVWHRGGDVSGQGQNSVEFVVSALRATDADCKSDAAFSELVQ